MIGPRLVTGHRNIPGTVQWTSRMCIPFAQIRRWTLSPGIISIAYLATPSAIIEVRRYALDRHSRLRCRPLPLAL